MGGSVGTRRVTVDQSGDVVQISDALIKRLAGLEDKKSMVKQALPITSGSDSEGALPNEEAYKWKARVESLERERNELNRRLTQRDKYLEELKNRSELKLITAEEYHKAVDEIEGKFVKTMRVALCHEEEREVLRCYQRHPTQPLRCAPLVTLFNDCVNKYHMSKSGGAVAAPARGQGKDRS